MGMAQQGSLAKVKLGRAGKEGQDLDLQGAGPRTWAKGAVPRGIKEPGRGVFSQGPAPIVQEGLSFSKALFLHGFLGG